MRYNFAADIFLYNETLQQTFRPVLSKLSKRRQIWIWVLYPHFEEVRGRAEPWWMARWKARVEFLLSVNELLFLSVTVKALYKAKCVKTRCLQEGVGHLEPRFQELNSTQRTSMDAGVKTPQCPHLSRKKGLSLGNIFGFYKTRHILVSDSPNCTVLRAVVLTQYRRVTDGQTDRRNCRSQYSACNASIAVRCKNAKLGFLVPSEADNNIWIVINALVI